MSGLVDAHGRPLKPSDKRPITDQIAVASVRDRWSTYPSAGLTPGKLARILREADHGYMARLAELAEDMEEKDCHLYSTLQTRKNAVLGLDWEVMAFSDEKADRRSADMVNDVLNSLEGFEDALLDLLDAIGKGFAVSEIMWAIEGKQVVPASLQWVHQKRFIFGERHELRLVTDDEPVRGIELPPNKFVTHTYKAKSGWACRAGVLRVVSWIYLFKNLDLKDWVQYAEVFGMPLRLGIYDATASEADKEALYEAVVQLGSDAAGIISKATEITFIEPKAAGGGHRVFSDLAEYCDRQISKAVLGQTLTSDVGASGSYAASKTHQQVRQDLTEADCKSIAETLRRYLIRPLVLFNYGPEAARRLPWIKFHYEPPEDLQNAAQMYATLVRDVGLPVSAEHVYTKFGIPSPQKGETILTPLQMMPMKSSPHSASAPDQETIARHEAQRTIDAMATNVTADGAQVFEVIAEPWMQIINAAESLEDLREKLIAAYGDTNTRDLEDLIARAIFTAELIGRWSANEE